MILYLAIINLDGIRDFKAIMSSKECSPFGDLVCNRKDRKMGEVLKADWESGKSVFDSIGLRRAKNGGSAWESNPPGTPLSAPHWI